MRPRSGAYLAPGTHSDIVQACAMGGRLTCVSELARLGVFVLDASSIHIHLHEARRGFEKAARSVKRHWGRLHRMPHPRSTSVELFATYRPIAEDLMWHPEQVRAALAGLLAGPRRRPHRAVGARR